MEDRELDRRLREIREPAPSPDLVTRLESGVRHPPSQKSACARDDNLHFISRNPDFIS